MSPDDRRLLSLFAERVRTAVPTAAVWAFGSRARGSAHPESDLDLCVVVPQVTRDVRQRIVEFAWEIGFDAGVILTPIVLSTHDFELAPLSASTLVANIRREGVAA